MAAHPFGGSFPTFAQYCTWAAQSGCSIRTGYQVIDDGEAIAITIIESAANGTHAIEADLGQDERLVPSVVASLDRRLGLTSPWGNPLSPD